jgi:transglutaminase-like putative cysteine protease
MLAVVLLASMGVDQTDPNGRLVLFKGLGAVLFLAAAYGLAARRLRREREREARGRVLTMGGREAGAKSALLLALGSLGLGLLLMAALEVAVSAVSAGDGELGASEGEAALERARVSRGLRESDEESSTGPGARRSPRTGPMGPGQHSGEAAQRAIGVRLGDLLSDEPILRATSAVPLPSPTAHLRGLVLDRYGSTGSLQERRAKTPASLEAGEEGWIEVPARDVPPGRSDRFELTVEFLAESNGVVFAPLNLAGIETPSATYDRASELWTAATEARYRVRSRRPLPTVAELAAKSARGSIAGSTSLPIGRQGSERFFALRSLAAYAESIATGSTTDLERVVAIVSHLRETFGYELFDVGMLDPEGSLDLIERGSGSCTHFASLAALLLRSLGIPTRIAVGYVAREELPPEEGHGWLVRARDGHAWIEVHFEGFGWLPFDPTPGDQTAGGASMGWTPLEESDPAVSRWLSGVGLLSETEARTARTSALGEWVAGALASSFRWMRDLATRVGDSFPGMSAGDGSPARPWAGWTLGFVASGALIAWAVFWRRRGTPAVDGEPARPSEGQSLGGTLGRAEPSPLAAAQDLMTLLAERGLAQGVHETPSEFARGVEAKHPDCVGLLDTLRALLRRASTHAPLTKAEMQALARLIARLRRGEEASGSGEGAPPASVSLGEMTGD